MEPFVTFVRIGRVNFSVTKAVKSFFESYRGTRTVPQYFSIGYPVMYLYRYGTRIAILVRTLYYIYQWILEYTKSVILSVLFWASSLLALGGLSHLGCIGIIAKAPQAIF